MNVFSTIRFGGMIFVMLVGLLLSGCATDLTVDGRSPLAAEPTPYPEPGPRGGWAW
jgi:hypothetical protein